MLYYIFNQAFKRSPWQAMQIRQTQKLSQVLSLTPQMRQSLRILQLPLLELKDFLDSQLEDNLVLEYEDIDFEGKPLKESLEKIMEAPELSFHCPRHPFQPVGKQQIHIEHGPPEEQVANGPPDEVRRGPLCDGRAHHTPDRPRSASESTVELRAKGCRRREAQRGPSPRGCRASTRRPRRVRLT